MIEYTNEKAPNKIVFYKDDGRLAANTMKLEPSDEVLKELYRLRAENEKLRNGERLLLAAIANALKTTVWMSDVRNGRWKYNKYNFDGKLDVYGFALTAAQQDIRRPLLDAILELFGQETRNKYQCHIESVEGWDELRAAAAALKETGDE